MVAVRPHPLSTRLDLTLRGLACALLAGAVLLLLVSPTAAEGRVVGARGPAPAAALTLSPAELEATLREGERLLAQGETSAALDLLTPLDGAGHHDAQWLLGRAWAGHARQLADGGASFDDVVYFHELALAAWEAALDLALPGDTRVAVDALTLRLYDLGDAEGALALADRILDSNPDSGEVLLLRGCAGGHASWAVAASGDDLGAADLRARAAADLTAAAGALEDRRPEPHVQLSWLALQEPGDDALPRALEHAVAAAARGVPGSLVDVLSVSAARGALPELAAAALALDETAPDHLAGTLAARKDGRALAEHASFAVVSAEVVPLPRARALHATLTRAVRDSALLWNNHALLCRDTGRYEEAYDAYRRALELTGPDPRLLNDTALVLHYHLMGDDPEKREAAERMYEEAIALAVSALESGELRDDAARDDLELALRDARDNLAKLRGALGRR